MDNVLVNKFNLGDFVTSKKTGLPMQSTVCGMIGPEVCESLPEKNYYRWTELYPDWRDKYVYYVKYTKPQKPISKEEMIIGLRLQYEEKFDLIPQSQIDKMYNEIPEHSVVTIPEDDLELL